MSLLIDPVRIAAVLLPDGFWYGVNPGSFDPTPTNLLSFYSTARIAAWP